MSRSRCDCLACFGFRLAAAMFLIGLAVILIIGSLLQAATPKPLIIENRSAARVTNADYSLCVRVSPGPLRKSRRDNRPHPPSELV